MIEVRRIQSQVLRFALGLSIACTAPRGVDGGTDAAHGGGRLDSSTALIDSGAGVDAAPLDAAPADGSHDAAVAVDAGDPCAEADGGGTWETLPDLGVLPGDTGAAQSALAMLGDTPYVSFKEWNPGTDTGSNVYVQRWTGPVWDLVGGPVSINMGADYNSIAIDPMGRPLVAWQEPTTGSWDIAVRRFESGTWTMVGAVLGADVGSDETPEIVVTDGIGPFVAWKRSSVVPSAEVVVMGWDGAEWSEAAPPLGASSGFDTIAAFPRMAASASALYLSWLEQNSTTGAARYHVAVLNAGSWDELGTPVDAPWGGMHNLTLDSAALPALVIVTDVGVQVLRWTGSEWNVLPPASSDLAGVDSVSEPVIALDSHDRPVVAFRGQGPLGGIYVRRFDGVLWSTLGVEGGAPTDRNPVSLPNLGLTTCGEPFVVWSGRDTAGTLVLRASRYHRTAP